MLAGRLRASFAMDAWLTVVNPSPTPPLAGEGAGERSNLDFLRDNVGNTQSIRHDRERRTDTEGGWKKTAIDHE